MDGNNQNSNNPSSDPNDVSMLDKIIQKNPFVKHGPDTYQNVRTQSMIQSSREEAQSQLAAINARNAEILRQQKLAEEAQKAKRTGVHIAIAIIFGIIVIAAAWIIIGVVMANRSGIGAGDTGGGDTPVETKYGKIGSYNCTTEKCTKLATIDGKRSVIRDGEHYYVYNVDTKEAILTTIPENEYHEMVAFAWAEKDYLVIDPETERSALFSLSDNRQVTEFAYDEFYTEKTADVYKDIADVLNSYIVARSGESVRLIRLSDGKEMVQATGHVYVKGGYFFGYENNKAIHIYDSEGKSVDTIAAGNSIFLSGDHVVVINNNDGKYVVYKADGTKADKTDDVVKKVNSIKTKERLDTINKDSSYIKIPAA